MRALPRIPGVRSPRAFGAFKASSGGVRVMLKTSMFFDRQAVKDATRHMNYWGLYKAAGIVRRYAMRSIKQRGHARPPSKIEQLNHEVPLRELVHAPGLPPRTRGMLVRKLREIRTRPPSAPGTPPHTHVPFSLMVGLKRNIQFGWDSATQSAVVGPSRKGKRWMIPAIHEHGMPVRLRQYMWHQPGRVPLVKWFDEVEEPRKSGWVPTKRVRLRRYPKRQYLFPALKKARDAGKIAEAFRDSFGRPGGGGPAGG